MKKGEVTLAVIVLIIVIIVFVGWMMREGWKECRSNRDCRETEYCGADFSCHEYKIVQVPSPSDRTTSTAWIIGNPHHHRRDHPQVGQHLQARACFSRE